MSSSVELFNEVASSQGSVLVHTWWITGICIIGVFVHGIVLETRLGRLHNTVSELKRQLRDLELERPETPPDTIIRNL